MPDTFPANIKIHITSRPKVELRRRVSKFGDGYSQRIIDGINNKETTWQIKMPGLTAAEKNQVIAFLDPLGGATSFYWTPQGESTPRQFVCPSYDPPAISGDRFSIDAVWEEVFDIIFP